MGAIIVKIANVVDYDKEDQSILDFSFTSPVFAAYILTIGVRETARRQGIAKMLINALIIHVTTPELSHCQAIFLHVMVENCRALQFYESVGFHKHCVLDGYYSLDDNVSKDAFTYILYINGGKPPLSTWKVLKDFCQELYSWILSPFSAPTIAGDLHTL